MKQACRGSCPCCGISDLFSLRVQMGNRIIKSLQEAEGGSDPRKRMEISDATLERDKESDLSIL